MKRVIGFCVVIFSLLLAVSLPMSASTDDLRVDNDVGYTFSPAENVTIPSIEMNLDVPVFTMKICYHLKFSMADPVISFYDKLDAGLSCNADISTYSSIFCQEEGDLRQYRRNCYTFLHKTQTCNRYETDYEGLYRLDIGECLWRS